MIVTRKIKIFLTIFSMFNFTTCSENINEPKIMESTPHFLLPATIGNYWEYTRYTPDIGSVDSALIYKNFNSFGLNLDADIPKQQFRWEIVDSIDIKIGNNTYPSYVFDTFYFDENRYSNFNKPFWFSEDGIYNMGIFEKGIDTVFHKGLYIPTSILLNVPWYGTIVTKQNSKLTSRQVLDRRCISKNESIEAPIGNFNCYVIYTRRREADDYILYIDSYEYFAINIGMICKFEIDIVPDYEVIPNLKGWWKLRYLFMINNYIVK